MPDNPKAENIRTLYQDRNDQVWIGTSDGLYKLIETNGQIIKFELVPLGKPLPGFGGAIAKPDPTSIVINTILEKATAHFLG